MLRIDIRDRRLRNGRINVSARTRNRRLARKREAAIRNLIAAGDQATIDGLRAGRVTITELPLAPRVTLAAPRTEKERFWSKVRRGRGCWVWMGRRDKDGYGLSEQFGQVRAHRAAYVSKHGSIPDGMCVLHRCDNPPCVRPDHLWVGTQADNVRDAARKGRMRNSSSVAQVARQ